MQRTRTMRRWMGAAAAIGAVMTSVIAPQQAQAKTPPPVPTIDWADCGVPEAPGVECGSAVVPLDYDKLEKGNTWLALARYPASDQANKIGTLFVNPGGPGGSGVEMVLFGFGAYLDAQLKGRFDIVGFDPRGVANSDPLHCFASFGEYLDLLGDLPVFPYKNDTERATFFKRNRQIEAHCRDQKEALYWQMNTGDVARDLDLLRQAVGDAKVNYLGFSYGSFLGQVYANLFPNNIRTLVIDGVLDPVLWTTGRQIESDRVATKEVLRQFFKQCDLADAACPFSGPKGSEARWDALRKALLAKPVPTTYPDGTPVLYRYDYLIADANGAMYNEQSWPFLAEWLDALSASITSQAPAAGAVRQRLVAQMSPHRDPEYFQTIEGYLGVACADTEYPSSYTDFIRISRYAEAGSEFGALWWWENAPCANWEVNNDRYMGPWTARTSAPVLVVGNYYDPATDYKGAQTAARLLPNSRLLTWAGWGHTAYGESACITRAVNAYLLAGTLPARGRVCPANPNPFTRTTTAVARVAEPTYRPGTPPDWLIRD